MRSKKMIVVDGRVHVPFDTRVAGEVFNVELWKKVYTIKGKNTDPLPLYKEHKESYSISFPRSILTYFMNKDVDIRDNRSYGRNWGFVPESRFVPRIGQEDAIMDAIHNMTTYGCSLLIADCGTGKTVMGSEIALRMKLTTCVLVHKEFLANQWEKAFEMLCPQVRVGRIQRDQIDTGDDFDVVVAVTQSLVSSKRTYSNRVFESFGLVIPDEVHRYGAEVWGESISLFPSAYRLGLTATPGRGDGMWPAILHHLGDREARLKASGLKPRVEFVNLSTFFSPGAYKKPWDKDPNNARARLISLLAKSESRTSYIIKLVAKALLADRKVFVLSERLGQLEEIARGVQKSGVKKSDLGFFVGGKKTDELDEVAKCKLILGTYQMAQEGMDIPDLDTLFIATPRASIAQSVGRILREVVGKKECVVVDFVDHKIGPCAGYKIARKKHYEQLGYTLTRQ